jgi:hypothetical protein
MKLKYNVFTGKFDLIQGVNIPQTGWKDPANYSSDLYFDADSTTVNELADVLATLIVTLKTAGVLSDPPFTAGDAMGTLGGIYA